MRLVLIILGVYLLKYQYEIHEVCTEQEKQEFDNRSLILADSPCNTLNYIYESDLECTEIRKKIQPKARRYAWRQCMWERQVFFHWGWTTWLVAGFVGFLALRKAVNYQLEKYKIDRNTTEMGRAFRQFNKYLPSVKRRKQFKSGLVIEELD